ncbi:MAG: tetratricopeptide repeat protein [Opitutae bacterium]|nr:tetratricopeptide repeat protein [Opitutae bacterium]
MPLFAGLRRMTDGARFATFAPLPYEGKLGEAEPLETEALSAKTRTLGSEHQASLESMDLLSVIYTRQGRLNEAEALANQGWETAARVLGPEHATTRLAQRNLGQVYKRQGKLSEAERTLREVLEISERARDATPDFVLGCAISLGETLISLGRHSDAESILRNALVRSAMSLSEMWQTSQARSVLGAALTGQQRFEEAEPLLLAGYRGLIKARHLIPPVEYSVIQDSGERVVRLFATQKLEAKIEEWKTRVRQDAEGLEKQ